MGTSATKAKNKYNKKTYKNFQSALKIDLFNEVDEYCKSHNISRSQFIEQALKILKEQES